jgi:hypothetical protein
MPDPMAKASLHAYRKWWLAIPVVALVAVYPTPFGGWLESFIYGTGVRWQEAYTVLDTAEANLPRNPRERERLLLLNALGEGEPPAGMRVGPSLRPRIHPVGTIARLRYETLDENGAPLDTWDVRALVPNIGNGVGREPCLRPCREQVARSKGTQLRRSGTPGITEEWVLRMPVGKTFELGPRPLRTQDILDTRERSVGIGSVRVGERWVPRPAQIRVTLVEACPATVRVGTAMSFEFDNSMIPLPRGFATSRWVEADGCGKLVPLPPPPPRPPPQHAQREIAEPPDLRAIVVRRDARTGQVDLKVDETWMRQHDKKVMANVATVCRYDPESDHWRRLPPPNPRLVNSIDPVSPAEARYGERVVYSLPREPGLYWLYWAEQDDGNRSSRRIRWRDARVAAGRVLCNDVALGAAPEGRIAACVPFANHAEARFVPEPAKECRS